MKSQLNYQEAVLATLAYFDLFRFPLTLEEATRYLLKLPPDPHHVRIALEECRRIRSRGSYYQLAHEKNYFETRHDHELIAQRLWKRVERYRWVFQLTPYVRGVFVCNTLAYNNPTAVSDIDLLVVTKPGRLFLSRLWLTFWLHVLGVRRHGKKVQGRFCLSFFVTEKALNLDSIRLANDIYLAYWIRTLQLVSGDLSLSKELVNQNRSWLKDFFSEDALRAPGEIFTHFHPTPWIFKLIQKTQEKMLNSSLGDRLEKKLQAWQLNRAEQKKKTFSKNKSDSSIVLTPDMLKFHDRDRRSDYHEQWREGLRQLQIILPDFD